MFIFTMLTETNKSISIGCNASLSIIRPIHEIRRDARNNPIKPITEI